MTKPARPLKTNSSSQKFTSKEPNKNPVGRPPKYNPKYCKAIIDFFSDDPYREREIKYTNKKGEKLSKFEDVPNDLKFISAFARSINVSHSTIKRWADKYEEFRTALKGAKELQKEHLVTCALRGLFDRTFSIFTAKNITDWNDTPLIDQSQHTHYSKVKVVIDDKSNVSSSSKSRNRLPIEEQVSSIGSGSEIREDDSSD